MSLERAHIAIFAWTHKRRREGDEAIATCLKSVKTLWPIDK